MSPALGAHLAQDDDAVNVLMGFMLGVAGLALWSADREQSQPSSLPLLLLCGIVAIAYMSRRVI